MSRVGLRCGFALVEVLIAVLLTSGCLLAVMPLFALMTHSSAVVWQRAIAAGLAQEKIEDLQHFSQLEVAAAETFGFDAIARDNGGLGPASGSMQRSGYDYQLSWQVEMLDACTAQALPTPQVCADHWRPSLKTLRVSVDWRDDWDEAQHFELQTDIAAVHPDLVLTALVRSPQLLPPSR